MSRSAAESHIYETDQKHPSYRAEAVNMYHQPTTHRRNTLRWRVFIGIVAIFTLWNIVDVRATYNLVHAGQPQKSQRDAVNRERVFIASNQYNSAPLLRHYWNQAILDLSKALGPSNVYLSIYESGSTDDTKEALHELDLELEKLGVRRSIVTEGWTHGEEMAAALTQQSGWIKTPYGGSQYRRIPFLGRLRNLSLEPLLELVKDGQHFDRVLFLNDVVFTVRI